MNPSNNIIMEIRAGAGGEEAALFASDLFLMYQKFSQKQGWHVEPLTSHRSSLAGFKEIIFEIRGQNAWQIFKQESGVHRVQRIPKTEKSGRIHTSTASVAVLQEPETTDININPKDLRIDVFRSSGAGGQHVNVTSSAVRITHLPTGLVVSCQDERSQHKNKDKAMKVLTARLLQRKQSELRSTEDAERRQQIGTADRSEKIRTYNFPQNRVTDHRIGKSWHDLENIIDGNLQPIIKAFAKNKNQE